MEASPKAQELIRTHEGLALRKYYDSGGKLTIGYGHKIRPDESFIMPSITLDEAEYYLEKDIEEISGAINKALDELKITQNQFDALVSLGFNIGANALLRSSLFEKLKAKNFLGAAAEFGKWNHCDGRILSGLTKRRAAECALFMTP